jgi:hypothetical protein
MLPIGRSAGTAGGPPVYVKNYDEAGESETYSGYAEGIPVEQYPSRRQQQIPLRYGRVLVYSEF